MSGGFKYLEGGPFQGPDDIIVDEYYAQQHKLHAGDHVDRHPEPPLARLRHSGRRQTCAPGGAHADLAGSYRKYRQGQPDLREGRQPANIPAVMAELKALLPDYNIYTMEEFTSLLTVENVGGLSTFIHVMVGIGVVIGFAVVLLSMYMAVLQRTREIGILKALGASRWFILKIILAEAASWGWAARWWGSG
jgi:putative ABC transport system permease protein